MVWRLLTVLAVLCTLAQPLAASPKGAPVTAPALRLPAGDSTIDLAALRGSPVIVDFWASWCVPCRSSFPWLAKMSGKYAAKGLKVIAVNLDKDRAAAAAFLEEVPAPFTVAYDPAGKTAEAFKVKAMPSTFLVSRSGTIVYSHAGFDLRKTDGFESRIEEACER